MRGPHYGTDARWFGRAFDVPGEIEIPELPKEEDTSKTNATEEASLRHGPSFLRRQHVNKKLLGEIEPKDGATPRSAGPSRPRSPLDVQLEQGAFRRAIATTTQRPPVDENSPGRRLTPGAKAHSLPNNVRELLERGILKGVHPEDISLDDIDRLRSALAEGDLRPSHGVQVMQAWARERRVAPELMLARLRELRNEWLANAPRTVKPNPTVLTAEPKDWDGDEQISIMLNQRHNAGYGPKDIDHEKMRLLQLMMSSFSGQVNYGFEPV